MPLQQITATDIQNGTITGSDIASGTITGSNLSANTISNTAFQTGSVENYMSAQGTPFGNRNKIINGAMMIDQRNAGAAVTAETYVLDRWRVWHQYGYTKQQSTDAPAGFKYSFKVTKTDSSQSAWGLLVQYIEGNQVADLGFGTANAATVTVSFWVKSSVTGAFTCCITNSAENRSYPLNYTINSANTWEYKTLTFPGDTSGTWLTDSNKGIAVQFNFGGNNATAAPGAWNNVNAAVATGSTNLGTTNGATFYITGVQLEKGATATPFENRLYGAELALCQRYFLSFLGNNVYDRVGFGLGNSTTQALIGISQPVPMRAAPTIAYSGSLALYNGSSVLTVTSFAPDYAGVIYSTVGAVVASGVTAGSAWQLISLNNITARVTLSSEL